MRRLIAAMLLVGVLGTEAMAEKKTAAPAAKTACVVVGKIWYNVRRLV